MYENEIYSGSGTGENTSGVFSGNTTSTANTTNTNNYGTYQTGSTDTAWQAAARNQPAGKPKKNKSGGFFKKALLSVSLGLLFGLFAGLGFYGVQQGVGISKQPDSSQAVAEANSTTVADNGQSDIKLTNTNNVTVVESDISNVVEDVMPAMVSIVNNYTETGNFFGQTYTQEQAASGSGIIVSETDSELLIVTNHHVVADATTLQVTFIDGSEAEAKIKGMDSDMDLAVLAVPLSSLSSDTKNAISVATLGNSDDLKLGEPVIAIGNALGYGQSVTNGIVSALNREITLEDGSTGTFIQTNAAINPGNSGGALLNINGEVVGINSNKIGGSTIEGMGYAIPISKAKPILEELMNRETREKVDSSEKGYLGVVLANLTSEAIQMYNMPTGAFVRGVENDSPAQECGICKGDIIVKFDGQKVSDGDDLLDKLQYYKSGEKIEAVVARANNGEYEENTIELTLGTRPDNE